MNVTDRRMVHHLLENYLAAVLHFGLVCFSKYRVQWFIEAVCRVDVGDAVGDYKLHSLYRVINQSSRIEIQGSVQVAACKQLENRNWGHSFYGE